MYFKYKRKPKDLVYATFETKRYIKYESSLKQMDSKG